MTAREDPPDLVDVEVGGRLRRIRLAVRSAGEVITDIRTGRPRTLDELTYLVLDLIDTLDGEEPGFDDAAELVADGPAVGRLLGARNQWWGRARLEGTVAALCPHCGDREARLGLTTVALALGVPPSDWLTEGGAFLAPPAIATPRPVTGPRPVADAGGGPSPAAAGRLRVELPSPREGVAPRTDDAVLRAADDAVGAQRQEQAWQDVAPPGVTPPADHAYRHRGSVGFTAIVRLSAALDRLGPHTTVTPADVEALSVLDFLCLDVAHALLFTVPAPRPDSLMVDCARCGGPFRVLGA